MWQQNPLKLSQIVDIKTEKIFNFETTYFNEDSQLYLFSLRDNVLYSETFQTSVLRNAMRASLVERDLFSLVVEKH